MALGLKLVVARWVGVMWAYVLAARAGALVMALPSVPTELMVSRARALAATPWPAPAA